VTLVRTVAGDIDPADLGVTYAHEHLIIDGGALPEIDPSFRLDSVDDAVTELRPAVEMGLRTVIDAMPPDAGRNVTKLAAIATRAKVHVVASTGVHIARYYPAGHWTHDASTEAFATRFRAEIQDGIDGTVHRAGLIKIGGSKDALSARDLRAFAAAAIVHRETGVPILAHCTDGTAALEIVGVLGAAGFDLGHLVLSHTDKIVDRGYHRELLSAGATVAFDGGFRWRPDQANGTLQLLDWLLEDGFGDQLMLGMDAARRSYWSVYGGAPGMTFLLEGFSRLMAERGIDAAMRRAMFVTNPARVFAFAR
jgi:5-phospho-D-xylono-1,4-lactonase